MPCCLNLTALDQVCWSLLCVTPDKCLWGRNVNLIPGRPGEQTGFSQLLLGHRAWAGNKSCMCGATDVKNKFPKRNRQVDISTNFLVEEGHDSARPDPGCHRRGGEGRGCCPTGWLPCSCHERRWGGDNVTAPGDKGWMLGQLFLSMWRWQFPLILVLDSLINVCTVTRKRKAVANWEMLTLLADNS